MTEDKEKKTADIFSILTRGKVQPSEIKAIDQARPANPELVKLLEDLTVMARAGELVAMAGVGFRFDGLPVSYRISGNLMTLMAQSVALDVFCEETADFIRDTVRADR